MKIIFYHIYIIISSRNYTCLLEKGNFKYEEPYMGPSVRTYLNEKECTNMCRQENCQSTRTTSCMPRQKICVITTIWNISS